MFEYYRLNQCHNSFVYMLRQTKIWSSKKSPPSRACVLIVMAHDNLNRLLGMRKKVGVM